MTASSDPDPQHRAARLPGTVFTAPQVRLLKVAVVVMGLALAGGFALVLGAIVYQASHLGHNANRPVLPSRDGQAALRLEPGQRITHIALDGGRLAVHLTGPAGGEIRVIDLATGKLLARLRVTSE